MPDPKRKRVRTQVCKTNKKGEKKCKYKMVKRTPKQLESYDKMMKRRKTTGKKFGPLKEMDVMYPKPIQK
jgi:hypothetical protein